MNNEFRRSTRLIRSQELTRRLQSRLDVYVRSVVASLGSRYEFDPPIEQYLISRGAWDYVYGLRLNPTSVFCHPGMLIEQPFVSLYYRGLCGLSQVEVNQQVTDVKRLEVDPRTLQRLPAILPDRALALAGLYNAVMSSIIENSNDWVLDNGYRNLIASIGITFDGSVRNTYGQIAEGLVVRMFLRYIIENQLLISPEYEDAGSLPDGSIRGTFHLDNDVVMTIASEPDISFRRNDELLATVEIKGGIDPKGALERLGAAEKSARAAHEERRRCDNFLIAGVITDEMAARLDNSDLFTEHFLLIDLLPNPDAQSQMFDEIFNHSLRMIAA